MTQPSAYSPISEFLRRLPFGSLNLVSLANKLIRRVFDDLSSPAFLLGWSDRMGTMRSDPDSREGR
jgi:hypothetical protein